MESTLASKACCIVLAKLVIFTVHGSPWPLMRAGLTASMSMWHLPRFQTGCSTMQCRIHKVPACLKSFGIIFHHDKRSTWQTRRSFKSDDLAIEQSCIGTEV